MIKEILAEFDKEFEGTDDDLWLEEIKAFLEKTIHRIAEEIPCEEKEVKWCNVCGGPDEGYNQHVKEVKQFKQSLTQAK